MARSQETFTKKENQKNKQKKKQDKELRKQERKANSKGGGLDNMMAYVDEFGRISTEPIDPTKKKKISAEDIEIGVPKREDIQQDEVLRGRVSFYNSSKGYGFIKDLSTQENIFVHISGVLEEIAENDQVTFERIRGPKGWTAVKVKKA